MYMLSKTLSPQAFRNEFANLSCYNSISALTVYTQAHEICIHSLSCVCTSNHVDFLHHGDTECPRTMSQHLNALKMQIYLQTNVTFSLKCLHDL